MICSRTVFTGIESSIQHNDWVTSCSISTAAAGRSQTAEIDEVIDKRYRITGVLGWGGIGSVYRAEHTTIRRPVALKLLHSNVGQSHELGKRFEREAFAAGRLDHPNCVTVLDFGVLEDGRRFLVMELLEGLSLEELLVGEGRLPSSRALHIARHVLSGLAHSHEAGVVHRDVKPANVMLTERDGDADFATLLDFGIAKLLDDAATEEAGPQLTQVGIAFGTPLYLSPEQAFGRVVDHRADLYSLSVLLFEMVAGRPPFDSDGNLEVLTMHTSHAVPPIRAVAPEVDVPAAVEALIRRGMAKNPDERFADAGDFIAAIDECLASAPAPRNTDTSFTHAPTDKLASTPTPGEQALPSMSHSPRTTSLGVTTAARTPAAPMPASTPASAGLTAAATTGTERPPWRWPLMLASGGLLVLALILGATVIGRADRSSASRDGAGIQTPLEEYTHELEAGGRAARSARRRSPSCVRSATSGRFPLCARRGSGSTRAASSSSRASTPTGASRSARTEPSSISRA